MNDELDNLFSKHKSALIEMQMEIDNMVERAKEKGWNANSKRIQKKREQLRLFAEFHGACIEELDKLNNSLQLARQRIDSFYLIQTKEGNWCEVAVKNRWPLEMFSTAKLMDQRDKLYNSKVKLVNGHMKILSDLMIEGFSKNKKNNGSIN